MIIPGLIIQSNFKDYYDYLCKNNKYGLIYNRIMYNNYTKNHTLGTLKAIGVETITAGAVKNIAGASDRLLVYVDIIKGRKELVRSKDAVWTYPNYYATVYYEEADGEEYKLLQVGSRRFRVTSKGRVGEKKLVVGIEEIDGGFNKNVRIPIFSIDFIQTRHGVLAEGFHPIENLRSLDINSAMYAEEVVEELFKALGRV